MKRVIYPRFPHFVSALITLLLFIHPPAWATIDNLKAFKQAYPGKEPKAYSCKVCHQGIVGKKGDLNAYGLALQQLKGPGHATKLAEPNFRAVESQDADGDGVSNGDELKAGTDPADPKSLPKQPSSGQTGGGK